MPQPLLHRLDVRAGPDEQRGLRVPELVEVVADVRALAPTFPAGRVRVAHRRPELAEPVVREVLPASAVERVGIHELEEPVGAHRRLLVLLTSGLDFLPGLVELIDAHLDDAAHSGELR